MSENTEAALPPYLRLPDGLRSLSNDQALALAKKCSEGRNWTAPEAENEYRKCPFHPIPGLLHISEPKWSRTKYGWAREREEVRRLEAELRTERVQNAALRKAMEDIYRREAKMADDLKRRVETAVGRKVHLL